MARAHETLPQSHKTFDVPHIVDRLLRVLMTEAVAERATVER